jgi:hypothetical protein
MVTATRVLRHVTSRIVGGKSPIDVSAVASGLQRNPVNLSGGEKSKNVSGTVWTELFPIGATAVLKANGADVSGRFVFGSLR